MNDLFRGASVEDIVTMVRVTGVQGIKEQKEQNKDSLQEKEKLKKENGNS
jgi:hypothetical protein